MNNEQLHFDSLPQGVLNIIFGKLGPKDLCRLGAACKQWQAFNSDKEANKLWKSFFRARWVVHESLPEKSWQELYGAKVQASRTWQGQFVTDTLHGHKSGVRCIKLCPEKNLAVTGSLDRTVRIWDLEAGLPLACSKLHGGTVRCVAVGNGTVLSGSTDAVLRIWDLNNWSHGDLPSPKKLCSHTGPISGLSLVGSRLLSCSWDCTVRTWSLDSLECSHVFSYDDWVWAMVCHGDHIVVASGKDVILQDAATGKLVYRAKKLRKEGHVACLEATQDGRYVFSGGVDGVVEMHDTRAKFLSKEVWRHGAGVSGLAFEDPWVASCALNGSVTLVNLERGNNDCLGASRDGKNVNRDPVHRHFSGQGGPVYSVDMCSMWLACGSEIPAVKCWNFQGAEAARVRSVAQKEARKRSKIRRQSPNWQPRRQISEDSESADSDAEAVDSAPDPIFPPSELIRHSCRYERQSLRHGMGGESTDDGEVLEGYA